jgi:hypothetical protein
MLGLLPFGFALPAASQNTFDPATIERRTDQWLKPYVAAKSLGNNSNNRRATLEAHRLSFSIAYIGLGDKENAPIFLKKAYEERSSGLTALKVDPTYDPLRGEPRFQALVQHIGLAQ